MTRRIQGLKHIQQRRRQITSLIEQLRQEDSELAIAERVLIRIAGAPSALEVNQAEVTTPRSSGNESKTVGDYILETLDLHSLLGDDGMTAREILEYIREQWMPSLVRTSFSPPLSRLCQQGKVVKNNNLYSLYQGQEDSI